MNELLPDNVDAFMRRFSDCFDSVVRSFELAYVRSGRAPEAAEMSPARVKIILSAMDGERGNAWCYLTLLLDDVQELKLFERNRCRSSVLSDGLKIRWFDGHVFVELYNEDRSLDTPDDVRQSKRYVAAREIRWEVTEDND